MPRHRRERVPRHWALRPVLNADRRARLTAAVSGARARFSSPSAANAEVVDATLPLPLLRAATGAGWITGAVRGLVVTPWFAAATGIVVAAGLWIYSPHAELKFPPSAVRVIPCDAQGCGTGIDQGGSLATTTRQKMGNSAATAGKSAAKANAGGLAVRRLKFSYSVLWQGGGKFAVRISVTGRRPPRTWKLTLEMPGDQITGVAGAEWQPSGADSGTATGSVESTQSQWQGASQGGDAGDGAAVSPISYRRGFSFVVFGQGTPVVPTGCRLNGVSCSFP
jgi:hypothetical protein